MDLDHVGIATDILDAIADQYVGLFDAELAHEETFDDMRIVFLNIGNGYLELIQPSGTEGPIASYINDTGPGIHHLAFRTDDIERAMDRARSLGVTPLDDEPRLGAWGHQVAFFHPRDTGGVLVEFVQH